jgi:nucleoside-diphosphate-sugar epimerase/alpha-beta hydrolase superfamily lysophospholipase
VRVAVTGCTSDFGTVILPRLFADGDVEQVVGIDLREPRVADPKLVYEREDVRSPRMRELFEGCDVVVHLAFVVAEIHDKEATHSINIGGSRNVIEAAHAAGARRLVLASSVASYGIHPDNPQPLTEEAFPRGNHDKYYFYDKAEVEHFVLWWKERHPEAEMTITQLRPVVICGPHFGEGLLDRGSSRTLVLPKGTTGFQWLHESDLADAFHRVIKSDHPGPFNVAPDDPPVPSHELAERHGQRLVEVPPRVAAVAAELLFRLHLAPVSDDWVGSGEVNADNSKLKRETGWQPRFTGREASAIHLLQRGRPLMRPATELHRDEVAEAALEMATAAVRRRAEVAPDELAHEWIPFRTGELHVEVHEAGGADATVVYSPDAGGHARSCAPLLAALRAAGFNAIGVDRPGHGLSTGRRGDAPIEATLDALEEVVRWARERYGLPVALAGAGLGATISRCALTREPDVVCAVCGDPGLPPPRPSRQARAAGWLARAAPLAAVPIGALGGEAPDSDDRLWNRALTARTVASFLDFRPQLPFERVATPVLAVSGGDDELVEAAAAFVREHAGAAQGVPTS